MKLEHLTEGMTIILDDGFLCRKGGPATVEKDDHGFYFTCQSGHHYLNGQVDHDGELAGIRRPGESDSLAAEFGPGTPPPPNLTDRLSKIGEGFLWCVHVIGPDDVLATASLADAIREADQLNAVMIDSMEKTLVASICLPAAWPWTAESHANDLIRRQQEAVTEARQPGDRPSIGE